MLTDLEIKTAIHSAITGDSAIAAIIAGRMYWLNQAVMPDRPFIEYHKIDTVSGYAFGTGGAKAEEVDIQISIYSASSAIEDQSTLATRIKAVLTALGYHMQPSNPEFLEDGMTVSVMRWRVTNV